MDIGIWVGASLLVAPCVFIKETRTCCRKCSRVCRKKDDPMDPDHAKKLSDVGVESPPPARDPPPKQNIVMSIVLRVFLCLVIGYVLALALLGIYIAAAGSSLVFSPKSSAECVPGCTALDCCDYSTTFGGATKQEIQFDEGRLDAWYLVSDTSDTSIPTPYVKILYNHGSGSNLAARYRTQRYEFLLSLGVKLFVYDYPGYGKSTGDPSEDSIYASAKLAYDQLQTLAGGAESDTLVLGRSMGGGVAVNLVTEQSKASKGLILQSTFSSLAEVAGTGMPILGWFVEAIFPEKFDSMDKIGPYSGCLYDAHSTEDEWVDFDQGKALYDAATGVPASCKVFVETSTLHDDPMTTAEKDALRNWVNARR